MPQDLLIVVCKCWYIGFEPIYLNLYTSCFVEVMKADNFPRADGAKRRARVLIPPGYLHPGKGKH
jgi:hypothetical protein